MAVVINQTIYHFHSTNSQNRFSTFEITEDGEEVDLWQATPRQWPTAHRTDTANPRFCPNCGSALQADYEFVLSADGII